MTSPVRPNDDDSLCGLELFWFLGSQFESDNEAGQRQRGNSQAISMIAMNA